ncbi:MAG TPA: hypothetical protein VFQ61_20655 [Polyangiaceae bacterium]|nr:hypothetical protein [Polyangiaceae bacterium]
MGADRGGPRRRLRADSLCEQFSEPSGHYKLALIHVSGALAQFPPPTRAIGVRNPLSRGEKITLKNGADKIT